MMAFKIINQYKKGVPLDTIAQRNDVSLHYVLRVLHRATVAIPQEIVECKEILKEMKCS